MTRKEAPSPAAARAELPPGQRPAQAVTEYSLVVFAVMGLFLIGGWNLLPAFIVSFQRYFDGFYVLLNLPIP